MTLSQTYLSRKQLLVDNLESKGVNTYSTDDGLTTLINGILDIQTGGGGGGASNVVQGTFTTSSTRASVGTVNINYNGNGYPIVVMIWLQGGAYNPNSDWYSTISQYDIDAFYMTKSQMSSTPTFVASASLPQNQAVVCGIYKSSSSNATTHSRNGSSSAVFYNSSNATTGYNCVRFKNDETTMTYYVGNNASNRVGFAPSKTYDYIIIYSE